MNAKLKELDLGIREQVDALVLDVMERETKTGKPYVVLKVTDGDTTAEVKKWDARLDDFLPVKNTAVVLNVKASLYGNETTYDTDSCVRSKRPPKDFIRKAPIDLDGTLDAIGSRLDAIADPDLKALMTAIFRDKKSQLRMWSAAKTVHHAIYGGLLYHSYRMMQAADALCQFYPAVDKDLVASGALLHDIGKLEELDTNTFGAADYTTKGSLLGHAYLGTDLVSFYARTLKTPADLLMKLQHMILSHHGAYGAPVLPQTPEAELLHHLDMIDSRMYQVEEALANTEPGTFSDKIFGLGVRVYHDNGK